MKNWSDLKGLMRIISMIDKKAATNKSTGKVRVSKQASKKLVGKTNWAFLKAEEKREAKQPWLCVALSPS